MVLTNSSNDVVECLVLDGGFNLGRVQRTIETEEVSDETSNVWGGHGSSGKGLSRSIVGSGDDVETRSPDINASTEVGERSLGVVNSGCSDGDSLLDASRGDIDNVLVLVSGGNDNGNTGVKELEEGTGS